MPTPAKRIQCLLRPDVLKLVETISVAENLSASKVVSMLVEYALETRGVSNKSKGKKTLPSVFEETLGKEGIKAQAVASKADVTDEDLILLQKFKALKEMGIL